MTKTIKTLRRPVRALAATIMSLLTAAACAQPDGSAFQVPLTPDGDPDLNGIWQAIGSAHWDIEGHTARIGPVVELGALGAIPAGMGVVEGGNIPYTPEALETRNSNREHWVELDPAVKCYMPGIPRATYMPLPFQIVQNPDALMFAYEFTSSTRVVRMDRPGTEADLPSWMGYSLGRWEGDTLVVDVTSQVADTWFDSSGNFHSEALVVEERYTPTGPNSLLYEVTLEDPEVFTEPWAMSMPLYRRLEPDARLLEFKCIPFAEEAMFGEWYRRDDPQEEEQQP
ncbi:MAG TPA: hypothetical protein QF572_18095 [Vicinamibacterales bacterium]|nr:hypothetical protein [Vicinamibacterales bacterium]